MKLGLLQGVPEDQRDSMKQQIRAASHVLDQIVYVLSERFDAVERKGLTEEDYKTSDWVFSQAFRNGRMSEIKQLIELLTLDKE